jgi:hypothetical protein
MNVSYSDPVVLAFVVIPVLLAVALVAATSVAWKKAGATRSTVTGMSLATATASIAWLAAAWAAAATGVLRHWYVMPPPFALFMVAIAVLGAAMAFSSFGRRLAAFVPLWALVGIQAFRLPLELAMHRMFELGVMPEQMTYTGRNFDIVTGTSAILVAGLVATGRAGRGLVLLWNLVGLGLLLNVVIVALLSTPVFRYFGDDRLNVWVTYPPFVWLPAVMVLAAFAGHLLIFRALALHSVERAHKVSRTVTPGV